MLREEDAVVFVWRCPDCSGVYEGEGTVFLYTDGSYRYCPCGGRLEEGVEPDSGRHYRLVIPAYLRGTSLHRQLESRLSQDEKISLVDGRQGDRGVELFSCDD